MKMLINGKKVDSSDKAVMDVINPATMEVIDTVPMATRDDIETALDFAAEGQKEWNTVPMFQRIDIIKKFNKLMAENVDELSRLLTMEQGKTITRSREEVLGSTNLVDNYCECARTIGGETYVPNNFSTITEDLVFTYREPLGVIACILPFNYPIDLYVLKVIPGLLMGNAVIIKPASDTPLTDIRLTELLVAAGVNPKSVQIVTGSGSKIGNWLIDSPKIDGVSLTGSTEVGIEIAKNAANHLHEVALELGGNDPLVIFDDCDLECAVAEAIGGRYPNSGQTCCASKRFIVQNGIRETFTEKLVEAVRKLKVGNPLEEDTDYGPQVSEQAAKNIVKQIDSTILEGAKIATGGKLFDRTFIEPTVLTDVKPNMQIAKDMEIFGPVWPVIGFDTIEEAINIANDTRYGLSSGVITQDIQKALQVTRRVQAACCVINGSGLYRTPEQGFGGWKMTGLGQEGGRHTLMKMSLEKTVVLRRMWKDGE